MGLTDDDKLQRVIAEKRHLQTIELLKKIAEDGSAADVLKQLLAATEAHSLQLADFVAHFKQLPAPQVNVEDNSGKLVDPITKLGAEIMEGQIKMIEKINELIFVQATPKKWHFTIEKELGPQGRIKGVTAEQLI